jgi:hypothetical protein
MLFLTSVTMLPSAASSMPDRVKRSRFGRHIAGVMTRIEDVERKTGLGQRLDESPS